MTILHVYVDDKTMAILTEYGQRTGRAVEDLAEAAIAEEALRTIHPNHRHEIYSGPMTSRPAAPDAAR